MMNNVVHFQKTPTQELIACPPVFSSSQQFHGYYSTCNKIKCTSKPGFDVLSPLMSATIMEQDALDAYLVC